MKQQLTILLLLLTFSLVAQDLPTEPANGYAFPIGTKFTIKIIPIDSIRFDYSIVKFEPFTETIDSYQTDKLFADKGEENTIDFYFCIGTSGSKEEERKKNMKVLLIFKNRTAYSLTYNSDIQRNENEDYEKTSNMGVYKGAKGTEMWPYMILSIGLNDFKIMK